MTFTEEIREFALDLGYSRVGFAPADDFTAHVEEMKGRGEYYDFFSQDPRNPLLGATPKKLMPEAKSIIVLVWDYMQKALPRALTGRVGRVYQARCYNQPGDRTNGARRRLFLDFLKRSGCQARADILVPDRCAGARAGVTSFGRNNFAYADGIGSFIVISSIVVDRELDYDEPTPECKCPPNCTKCMDACPTGAIYEPFHLNPRRCLAFNAWKTTEDQGFGITEDIPLDIRRNMGERVHGCDVCQEVCPRNQARLKTNANASEDVFLERIAGDFSLPALLSLTDEFYEKRVYPIMYNYIRDRKYFRRNAAVAMGNSGDDAYVPALADAMRDEAEVVRTHAAWALGRIGGEASAAALRAARSRETNPKVRDAIAAALEESCVVRRSV